MSSVEIVIIYAPQSEIRPLVDFCVNEDPDHLQMGAKFVQTWPCRVTGAGVIHPLPSLKYVSTWHGVQKPAEDSTEDPR